MYIPCVATLLALASGALGWEISIYNQQNCNSGSNFDYVRSHATPSIILLSCCTSVLSSQLIHVLTLSLY